MTVQTFTSIINQLLPEPHAGLLAGILFGIKANLAPDLNEALITTGTLHIIALSGTNITLLTKIVNTFLLKLFPVIPRRVVALITIAVITGFIFFVGPSPSVIRAGIMGAITLISVVVGRTTIGLISWLVAVMIMLLFQPAWITNLSFQLSALASLGIVLFEKVEDRELKIDKSHLFLPSTFHHLSLSSIFYTLYSILQSSLRSTLSAQVFTIPLILLAFGRISLISPLTNILIGWTIPTITILGFIICLTGLVALPLAQVLAWGAWVFLQYVIIVVTWTSRIPMASIGR